MEHRTQTERDANTIEIVYALVLAAVLAGAAFLAVAGYAHALGVTSPDTFIRAGQIAAAAAFVATAATVLLQHRRTSVPARRRRASAQPSQPGRTRPDS
ncbi:DUF6332 family protein [Streptomyces sp. NPDC041068]|uniref:DUF6332 family protein n=1 Tax=Streptomyces sp. NPDC041068 TaxID=3155130 RepID=UPI0033E7F707